MALAYNWESFIRIHGGEPGARDMFEKAMDELLREENPDREVHLVKASRGDGGIDIYVHHKNGIDIYQCKFFMGSMTLSRWSQIKDSFNKAMEPKGVDVLRWYLCLPREMQKEDIQVWDQFLRERDSFQTEIRYIDGNEIINRMQKCGDWLINKYFDVPVHRPFTNKDLIIPFTQGSASGSQGNTYVPRHDLLDKIAECYDSQTGKKRIVFLSGMGGCGKSELARAYADVHKEEYEDIFWLTCSDGETLELMSLFNAAKTLRTVEKSDVIGFPREVLIIVDNCNMDDPGFLHDLTNGTGNADILVTTRLPIMGDYDDQMISVESDDPEGFACAVFEKNYCKKPRRGRRKEIGDHEKSAVLDICREVQCNTMIVSLIGVRLREYNNLTILECAEKIRDGVSTLKGRITYPKDQDTRSEEMKEILLRYNIEELLSDQELIEIWDRHREEEPEDGQITASLLELIGRQRNYDYRDLDFSGLDLTNVNIHSHLSKRSDICPLPSDNRRFERTKISLDCLISDGHAGRIRSIALSPDGMYLAGGTDDGKLRIWNLESGESRVLEGHIDVASSVAFSSFGRQLAIGSSDGTIRVWDLENMTCVGELEGHADRVNSVAFSPDGGQLASGSSDGTVRIWYLESMTCGGVLEGHGGGVNSVAFSPDGRYLASGSSDRAVRIWYPQILTCEKVLEGHAGGVNSVAFSPDSRYLASGSSDMTVRIWNPASGESRVLEGHAGSVNSVAFSPDGRQLASGSSDRTVRKWDPETEESKVLSRFAGEVYGVAFNPDDSQLAIGINDGTVRIMDLESYREIWKYVPVPPSLNLRGANFQLAIIDGKDLEILKAAGVLLSEQQLTSDADHGGMDSAYAYQIRNQIRRFFEQDPQKYCHVESFIDFIRENDTDDMRSFLVDELYYLLRISESDNVIFPLHQDPVLQQLIYQIWVIDTQRLRMQEIVTRPDADDVPIQAPQSSQEKQESNDIKRPLEDQQKSSVLCDDVAVEEATEIVLRYFQDWLEKELNEKEQKYRIIQSARRQSSGDQHGYDVGLELQIGDATYKLSFECKDYTSNIKENGRNRNTKIRSYAGNLLQYFINSERSVNNRWVLINVFGDLQNDYPSKLFETWNKTYKYMQIYAITEKSSVPTCKQFFSVDENAFLSCQALNPSFMRV